jgi:hypothetical protein
MKKYLILLISLLLSYSCNQTKKKSESIHKYKISLNSKNDSGTSGLVTIKQVNNGKVELEAHIMGLNPGNHAITSMKKLIALRLMENQLEDIGIQLLKIMVLGDLKMDITKVILVIFLLIKMGMEALLFQPTSGV